MLANRALRGNLREEGFVTRREAAEKAGRAKEDMRLFGAKKSDQLNAPQLAAIAGLRRRKKHIGAHPGKCTHLLNILRDEELRLWMGRRGWLMWFSERVKKWEVDEEKPQQRL